MRVVRNIAWALVIALAALSSPQVSEATETPDSAPLLTLDQAIQIAVANNRSVKILSLIHISEPTRPY